MGPRPDERLARELVQRALGVEPLVVHHFTTGWMHYVYEAIFADRPSVVIRIAADYGHEAMRGAATLSRQLRPLGVPLPKILFEDLSPPFPHLILERLQGTDIGGVIAGLNAKQLESIAAKIVTAQKITASLPTSGRYGYAVSPETAPHESWFDVLTLHFDRTRSRIAANGRYDVGELDPLIKAVAARRSELDAIPATPFLHDTTTKNVIVTPDGIFSGIVDVDDLCYGDPRYAIALTHVALVSDNLPTTYTEAWMRLAGFADDEIFHLYLAKLFADFMSERGQAFNGNERPSDPAADARLLELYREALSGIA